MPYDTFIYKYQPVTLDEFHFSNEMLSFYKTMLSLNNLNFLIFGPRSSGKTNIINVLVKEYYKGVENYDNNILIINNLNSQGIDYFRNEVKIFCQIKSSIPYKKKLILLDDIDLINDQNQQVFRNYIDKYNNNVNFLASCSNSQKVIESIQSRLTIIKTYQLSVKNMNIIMNNIITKENIDITPEAKIKIIDYSNNNPKVLINYLEKLYLLDEKVDTQIVEDICTSISYSLFEKYTSFIIDSNLSEAIQIILNVYKSGYSVIDILDSYFNYVKYCDCLNDEQKYRIIPFICKYISIFHNIHEDEIELIFFTNNLVNYIKTKLIYN